MESSRKKQAVDGAWRTDEVDNRLPKNRQLTSYSLLLKLSPPDPDFQCSELFDDFILLLQDFLLLVAQFFELLFQLVHHGKEFPVGGCRRNARGEKLQGQNHKTDETKPA